MSQSLKELIAVSPFANFLIFGVAFYIAKRQVDASLGERKSTYKMLWQQPEMFPPWFRIYSVLFVLHVLLTFYAQ